MIFEPDQINMPVRSLKRRRPDIYQLLLPELEALSPEQPLEKAIGTMIRLILALQKHRELTHV